MGIKRIIAPTVEPITVAEAKLHQRIDVADDDALVSMWITAIREHAEHLTGRTLAPTTWCLYLDEFSTDGIEIPGGPVTGITSVQYVDAAGDLQTLASTEYALDDAQEPSWLLPADGVSWPATRDVANAVRVTFTAGYAAADIPAPIKAYMLAALGTCYANREHTAQADRVPKTIEFLDRLLDRYRVWAA